MNFRLLGIIFSAFLIPIIIYVLFFLNNRDNELPTQEPVDSNIFAPVEGIIPNEQLLIDQTQIEADKQAELEKIKIENIKIFNLVAENGDIDLCNLITDESQKTECIDNGYAAKASIEGNMNQCKNIKDLVFSTRCLDTFYYAEAIESKKSADCMKISNEKLKATCTSNQILSKVEDPLYTGGVSICNSLSGDQKAYCINRIEKSQDVEKFEAALESNTISACNTIQDINMKNACYDTIYMKNAFSKEDISLCEKIDEISKKENCLQSLGKILDSKLFKSALEKSDVKLCENIINFSEKAKCSDIVYFRVAVNTKNKALCPLILATDLNNQCNSLTQ